jgi:putative membrane protein
MLWENVNVLKTPVFQQLIVFTFCFTLCLFIILLPFGLISLLSWFAVPLITTIASAFS